MPETKVRNPAGEVVKVKHPEGASESEILEFAQKQYKAQTEAQQEPVVPEPSYVERVMAPMEEFKPEFTRRLATQALQIPGVPGTGQIGISDVAGTAISQAARTGGAMATEAFTPLVPNYVKDFFDSALTAAGQKFEEFAQNPGVQEMLLSISSGYDSYKNWEKNNKALAEQVKENLGVSVDLATLFSPRPDLVDLDLRLPGEMQARKAGVASKLAREKEALTSMLTPESFTSLDRVELRGPLETKTWVPNEFDESVIDVVQTIPGIKPYSSVSKNFTIIQDHVKKQGERLQAYIKTQNKKVDMEALNFEFSESLNDFLNSDVFQLATPAAQKQFIKYTDLAQRIIKEEGGDLKGLLEARKRFDDAVQASGQTLDADVDTYQGLAAKLVRGVMNDYMKANTKGNDVHNLLDQQFRSLTALDRLVGKRNREGVNAPARLLQTIRDNTGIAVPTTALSVLATGAAFVSPAAAGVLGTAALGTALSKQIKRHGKAVVLKGYAELLSSANKAIKTINDPLQLERMELDRLVLIDLIDEIRNYEETEENE
jgi:hypothetical protein